jgi:hypothetical protein
MKKKKHPKIIREKNFSQARLLIEDHPAKKLRFRVWIGAVGTPKHYLFKTLEEANLFFNDKVSFIEDHMKAALDFYGQVLLNASFERARREMLRDNLDAVIDAVPPPQFS